MHQLFDAAVNTGWTLVGYRLPGARDICWLLPSDSKPVIWSQQQGPGFLLAPFSFPGTPAHWIARDISFNGFGALGDGWKYLPEPLRIALQTEDSRILFEMSIKTHQNEEVLNEVGQSEFELQVKAVLQRIAAGYIEKVVLARSEAHLWPVGLHPVDFVERLCIDYPQAFVNLILHPVWGLWIGATPELLLEMEPMDINNPASDPHPLRRLRSMALAGTLPVQGKADDWGEKEIREQQVVDDYIAQSWKSRIRNFHRSERSSIYAGPVQHLHTLLEGESDLPMEELVGQLHPTPAVGGWPKDESLNVMSEIERGSRQLYGGFMGPVGSPDEARLFVNLRTLQIRGAQAHLHMGCGILGGSEPNSEWQETVYKSKTLLRHLYFENHEGIQPVV